MLLGWSFYYRSASSPSPSLLCNATSPKGRGLGKTRSFAAPLYGENAADASVFTLNLTAGRGALLHCFCAVPESWQTLELTYHPDFAAGRSVTFTVHRSTDKAVLGMVPASPAEVGSVVDL